MTAANESVNESLVVASSQNCKRSQILGTQVISQATAARLGLVDQVWVDLEQKQVLVLGVRQAAFSGGSQLLELSQVSALGRDALLIRSEEVFDDLDLDGLVKLVGSDVVTEAGIRLGKVKDFIFEPSSGLLTDLVLSALGIPLLSGYVDTTYLMAVGDILSAGSRRIIAVGGAETRLVIEQENLLRRWFNVGVAPWESPPQAALPSSTLAEEIEEEVFDEGYEDEYEEEYEQGYADSEAPYESTAPAGEPMAEELTPEEGFAPGSEATQLEEDEDPQS